MLELEGLRICYGDYVAVSSASLRVEDGQIAALVGMNGAGKSSLLNAAAGLIRPSAGRVLFDGENLTGLPPEQIVSRGLSLVPQGGRCFARMSVRDNLLVGSYPKKARPHAAASLERVYALFPVLREKRNRAAASLSGGQRQMLAIGRALMSEPKCLIFDEISLGLAPVAIRDIYACIRSLSREQSLAVLLVEQDTERVLQMSDVCFVMHRGSVVMSGKTDELDRAGLKQAYFGFR